MDIFEILNKLYTSNDCKWISDISDSLISPVVIQRFLSMDVRLLQQVGWLDKYVYSVKLKTYLALAWSVIPKGARPYTKYIKENKLEGEYNELLEKLKHLTKMSDNDYNYNKKYILYYIKRDTIDWFIKLGMDKNIWKKYNIKYENKKKDVKNNSLNLLNYIKM